MERFTISLSDSLAADFDSWLQAHGYTNRSEGVRDLLRKVISTERITQNQAEHAIATISYVYNHHERSLAERLTDLQHSAHDLVISSTHVHLDHDNCLESLFLRGSTKIIQDFAQMLSAEPGIRHSVINLIPAQIHEDGHNHHDHNHHTHIHPLS
jgi:CopG family transcriptional regulator, nickel-responsive regulator